MSAVDNVDEVLEQYHLAAEEFIKGNPEPYKMVFSHREDVTLANPYGPPVRGWEQVSEALERTASRLRDGELVETETVAKCVTAELAYVVSLVREKAKVGGSEDITPIALRTTMILRHEGGTWKVVHLHGDPITTPQPAESVIQD
ncbi:MAG: nuclear transport factor 2 family protein [Actinomycetota bacterium]|nr:nuclear transport factor 2 family protein [Actinomycetota bacterium]